MVLIKNPFKSKATQSSTTPGAYEDPLTPPATIKVEEASPRPSATISRPIEPDYKLSSVSPEGTFIPPSPPEKTSFLSRFGRPGSANQGTKQSKLVVEDDSGFVIPRESFDGYRRSFDIRPSMEGSGSYDGRPSRASLDRLAATSVSSAPRRGMGSNPSRLTPLQTTTPSSGTKKENVLAPPLIRTVTSDANEFEEVKLDDEVVLKKKHFWQRPTQTSLLNKKERGDSSELSTISANKDSTNLTQAMQQVDLIDTKGAVANGQPTIDAQSDLTKDATTERDNK